MPKPFTPAQIRHLVDRACERRRLTWRVEDLEHTLCRAVPDVDLTSEAPRMRSLHETVTRAAASDAPVLLRGETGTGKTVVARTLHAHSPRREHPFVVVNCPTLSEELLTSELFGHARGSFTGAVKDQPGRVEAAHGGACFSTKLARFRPTSRPSCRGSCRTDYFSRRTQGKSNWRNCPRPTGPVLSLDSLDNQGADFCPHSKPERLSTVR